MMPIEAAANAETPTVLIVEDEIMIHDLLREPLEQGGYAVKTAVSADEAIASLEAEPTSVQALITDINLGRGMLTGWDVARRARELNPAIPVVYMTGDSGAEWSANGVPDSQLVVKPFAPAQVVTAVSTLITAAAKLTSQTIPPDPA